MISVFDIFHLAYTENLFLFVYGPEFTVLSKLTGLGTEALEVETNFQLCLRGNMLILVNDIVAFGDVFECLPCRVIYYHCRKVFAF